MGSTPNILENAKKALEKANNFTRSTTSQAGNKANPFSAPPLKKLNEPATDYSHAREARKAPGEFLGIRSDEAPDIKSGLESREAAKKALEQ